MMSWRGRWRGGPYTIAQLTNNTGLSIRHIRKMTLMPLSSFLLSGVSSPFIENIQHEIIQRHPWDRRNYLLRQFQAWGSTRQVSLALYTTCKIQIPLKGAVGGSWRLLSCLGSFSSISIPCEGTRECRVQGRTPPCLQQCFPGHQKWGLERGSTPSLPAHEIVQLQQLHNQYPEQSDYQMQQQQPQMLDIIPLEESIIVDEGDNQPMLQSAVIEDKLTINPTAYNSQVAADNQYANSHKEISGLIGRQWQDKIYKKTYKGLPAAAMVHAIFIQKRAYDEQTFTEVLSEHISKSDDKIQSIQVRVESFDNARDESTRNSLDDIMLYSDYALNAFYKGELGIELTSGQKSRKIHVKTTLKKAIMFMKVFPYTETQTFYVVSPRLILVKAKIQLEKIFYSDHYYIELFYMFEENLTMDGDVETTISLSCDLVFVKHVKLIKDKISDYYKDNMLSSFNKYLRPQLEKWIQDEIIAPREQQRLSQVLDQQPKPRVQSQRQFVPPSHQKFEEEKVPLQQFNGGEQYERSSLEDSYIAHPSQIPSTPQATSQMMAPINSSPSEKQLPEQFAVAFIGELRKQTRTQLSEKQFNTALRSGMLYGHDHLISSLMNMGVTELDLSHPLLQVPDESKGCSIF